MPSRLSLDAPRVNTPDWLWQRWVARYGEERAHAIAAANLIEPPLDLTVKSEPEHWAERDVGPRASQWKRAPSAQGPHRSAPRF